MKESQFQQLPSHRIGQPPTSLSDGLSLALSSLTAKRAQSALASLTPPRPRPVAGPQAARQRTHSVQGSRPETLRSADAGLDEFIRALASGTRRQILRLLQRRESCVREIVELFELSQPTISRHLNVLKRAKLVTSHRQGRRVVYELSGEAMAQAAESFLRRFCPNCD
ncbi:MAG: winged helix-turn-helix transcriptional regulator [bacterium]|nr:winged helix-turn-helix transcriptional regulator [bacterium]